MQRGRKSAASVVSLAATTSRPPLIPIGSRLTEDEQLIFDHTAKTNPHLKPSDSPMLALYAASIVRAMKARRRDDETFEKESRCALAIGRSLRVTPQSTVEPRSAARARAEQPSGLYVRKPWDRSPGDSADEGDE